MTTENKTADDDISQEQSLSSEPEGSSADTGLTEQETVQPDAETPEAPVEPPRVTPGSLLLAQRETLELSLQHVADELNLTMHYVRALESDSYDKLPGDVFVKGYIRSYARLLGLDPDQMLEIYREFTTHKLARKEEAIKRHARRRMDKNRPWIIFSGVAFVVVAVLLWFLRPGSDSPAPAPGAGDIARQNIDDIPVFDSQPATEAEVDTTTQDDPLLVATDGAADAASAIDGQASVISLFWPGEDRLQLSFSEDSRVQIEHRGGDENHQELRVAGEHLSIQGTAPFAIVLDNAAGVTLSFNGREADISGSIRADGSARLNIGL